MVLYNIFVLISVKSTHTINEVDALLDRLEGLKSHGQVKVHLSDSGSGPIFDIIAFATNHMIATFHKFPDVIYMDG